MQSHMEAGGRISFPWLRVQALGSRVGLANPGTSRDLKESAGRGFRV